MLRKFIGERYFCGLDIGAQSIKASLLKSGEDVKPVVLGVFETQTHGFKDASVSDLADLSECIHKTIVGLVRKTGVKLKEIQLGMGGELIEPRFSAAVMPLVDRGTKIITNRDVEKIETQAKLLGVKMDEVVLHHFSQYFKIDDTNTALNPVGLYGRKLEVKTLLVIVNNMLLKNLIKAVNQAGYDVSNVFFSSLCSAEAVLSEYQKRQGSVLIDIGSTQLNLLIFKEGQLKYLSSISLGGDHVTRNISQELQLAFDLAENIKQSYAFAISSESRSDEEILIKREEGYFPVKKERISHAVEPVVEKLVDFITSAINASGFYDQINMGIIMVGGGSLLPGLPERIEQNINLSVKLGHVLIASKRLHNAAKYASSVGLAQLGLNKAYGFMAHPNGHANFVSFIANKIKELYQEYF